MTDTFKEYYFTDKQIDTILQLVRSQTVMLHNSTWIDDESCNELANLIEDQIVNHPTNS
jgi:hypothetical protein